MFAVIKTGGKQYKVAKDDIIKVEKLNSAAGDTVELTDVLMVGNETAQTTGTPYIEGATVAAEVLEQARDKKIIVFKKKRRKDYRRTKGHRQHLTVLRITDILTDGKKPAKRAAAKKPAPETAKAEDAPKAAEAEKPAAAKPKAKPAAKADDAKKPAETKKPAAKASDTKKPAAKKPAAKKPAAKKPAAKASAAKKPAAKKPAAKRAPAKKPAAKKSEE